MFFNHNGYLDFELPTKWISEQDGDNLLIYNPEGQGAMVVSFFNILDSTKTMDEQVSIMAKRFIEQNKIKLNAPLILMGSKNKLTLFGTGMTLDNWFIKLWVVARYPKIVFVTYQSEKKSKELGACDAIIESMCFKTD